MKFLLALALMVTSSLSFASNAQVLEAAVHDVETRSFACDWSNILNTMSDFEAHYRVVNTLKNAEEITVNANSIDTLTTWDGGLRRMTGRIYLNAAQTRVTKVKFEYVTLKEHKVNVGTIMKPQYETRYTSKVDFAATCIVR